MKKWIGILALILALLQVALIVWFESLHWPLDSVLLTLFSLFLAFTHCLSIALSKTGLLQKVLYGTFVLQIGMIALLMTSVFGLKTLWYAQFSVAFLSICIGLISSCIQRKISPLIYYVQYMILAIIAFCLFALGMNPISVGTITIGFSFLCLLSVVIHLLTKEKKPAHSM